MLNDFITNPNEQILDVRRLHWVSYAPLAISGVFTILLGLFLIYAVGRYPTEIVAAAPSVPGALGLVSLLSLVMFILAAVMFVFGTWAHQQNRLILTTDNVIQINQSGLFARKVSQLSLNNIQEVTGVRNGVLPTIFGYGSIVMETAGEQQNFTFNYISDPENFANEIMRAQEAKEAGTPTSANKP